MKRCPICLNEEVSSFKELEDSYDVNCNHCGLFIISSQALLESEFNDRKKLSTVIKERTIRNLVPFFIISKKDQIKNLDQYVRYITVEEIINMFPITISERIDRTLHNLTVMSKFPGDKIKVTQKDVNLFFTQSTNTNEVFFLLKQLIDDGLIEGHAGLPQDLVVTVKGWNRVAELEKKNTSNDNQAFVAMWFSEEMNKAYEFGIKRAIETTGFKALRIDKKEHNNKIDDEIIAEIKKSKFIISDFTGQRGGVYFEAGFAMGLGKPVIWTCRKDHLSSVHFDTRQYSHIVWDNEDDLYFKLLNRIRATL